MLDDKDEKIAELEAKLLELSEFVEETGVALEDFEQNAMMEKANMFSVDQNSPPFQVHWILPEETESFSNCDEITSVKDAQKAFKEAAEHRDESVKRVLHGDVLFLLCNKAPEPVTDPNDPDNTPERGVCYYIGLCAQVSMVQMGKDPDSQYNELTETILTDAGEPNREFFAWSSCGGEGGSLECDRNEEYVTVVTDTKIELESTGVAPNITHYVRSYEKTKLLEYDECGTLIEMGEESEWTLASSVVVTGDGVVPDSNVYGCETIEICDASAPGGTRTIYVATHSSACP